MEEYFQKIEKSGNKLHRAMVNYVDNMPTVKTKLLNTERQSNEEDELYSESEIEENVEKQLENHPINRELTEAYDAFLEAFT